MERNLTNDHRRLLGVAIAMAKADGVLDTREKALFDHICEELHLSAAAREEVAAMIADPPEPEQIGAWAVTDQDRLGIFVVAVRMADADNRMAPEERRLLDRLAKVMGLTPEDVAQATSMAKEVHQ